MILFTINLKILLLLKWSFRSPQLCWLLKLAQVTDFENVVQYRSTHNAFLMFVPRSLCNHPPLKCRCSIKISNRNGSLTVVPCGVEGILQCPLHKIIQPVIMIYCILGGKKIFNLLQTSNCLETPDPKSSEDLMFLSNIQGCNLLEIVCLPPV